MSITDEQILESIADSFSMAEAAAKLKMSRVTLWRKMKKFAIET